MLLREFKIDNHTIILNQDEDIYIAKEIGMNGEKVFYHEYKDYDKIKAYFDEIVQNIQEGNADIKNIIDVLEKSTI
jgi:predicted DNA-binding ArsR family transcriptional regulator